MRESTTWQGIYVEGKIETLLMQGTSKWGAPPARVRSRIQTLTEVSTLDNLLQRVLDAKSWKDLLDVPPGASDPLHPHRGASRIRLGFSFSRTGNAP